MDDPGTWLIWYVCGAMYTAALTINWMKNIRHIRAAILWPVFWLVVAFSSRRKP